MGDKARCYFQPQLINKRLRIGSASVNQISAAAYELILQCAVRKSMGGIATNIGGDGNVAVVLGEYTPHEITCRGTFESWRSCRAILGDMLVTEETEVFGPGHALGVDVPLPMLLQSVDQKCFVKLYGNGHPDTTSWYKLWEAVNAVFAKCARNSEGGIYKGFGGLGNLFFTMLPTTLFSSNHSQQGVFQLGSGAGDSDL